MRAKKNTLILILCFIGLLSSSSCHVLLCETLSRGTLKLTNESVSDIYTVMVNGSSRGTIGPDESLKLHLNATDHEYELISTNGGINCGPYSVDVFTCETERISCSFGKCSY